MRLVILAAAFGLLGITGLDITGAQAQSCETLNLRDASGTVVSTNRVCVDEHGKWADPASVEAPLPQATVALTPQITVIPVPQPAPVVIEQSAPSLPETAVTEAPQAVATGWQPTSTASKRQQLYARLGLVCKARRASFCSAEMPCAGRCEGKNGWCDGRTGEIYASLEAAERANCRRKKTR